MGFEKFSIHGDSVVSPTKPIPGMKGEVENCIFIFKISISPVYTFCCIRNTSSHSSVVF